MTQHHPVLERPLGGAGPGLTARCTAGFYCPEEGALAPPSLQGLSSQLLAGLSVPSLLGSQGGYGSHFLLFFSLAL